MWNYFYGYKVTKLRKRYITFIMRDNCNYSILSLWYVYLIVIIHTNKQFITILWPLISLNCFVVYKKYNYYQFCSIKLSHSLTYVIYKSRVFSNFYSAIHFRLYIFHVVLSSTYISNTLIALFMIYYPRDENIFRLQQILRKISLHRYLYSYGA